VPSLPVLWTDPRFRLLAEKYVLGAVVHWHRPRKSVVLVGSGRGGLDHRLGCAHNAPDLPNNQLPRNLATEPAGAISEQGLRTASSGAFYALCCPAVALVWNSDFQVSQYSAISSSFIVFGQLLR
jgi:hypothetical protein